MGLRGEVRTNKAIKYIILRRTAGWSTRAFRSALPSQILPRPFRRGTRHAGLNTKLLLKRVAARTLFAANFFHDVSRLASSICPFFLLLLSSFFPFFLPRSFVRSFVPWRSHTVVSCVRRCKPSTAAFAFIPFLSTLSDLRGKSGDVSVCRARPGNTSESCPRFETRTRYDIHGWKVRRARSNPMEILDETGNSLP